MENVAHIPDKHKRSGRYPEGGHPRVHKVDCTKQLVLQSEASLNLSSLFLSKNCDLRMQGSIKNSSSLNTSSNNSSSDDLEDECWGCCCCCCRAGRRVCITAATSTDGCEIFFLFLAGAEDEVERTGRGDKGTL